MKRAIMCVRLFTPSDPSIAVIDGLKLATKYGKKDIKAYLADVLGFVTAQPWARIPCLTGANALLYKGFRYFEIRHPGKPRDLRSLLPPRSRPDT
jgi:hypothetical protein